MNPKDSKFPKNFEEALKVVDNLLSNIDWIENSIQEEIKKRLRRSLVITYSELYSSEIKFGATKWGGLPDINTPVKELFKDVEYIRLLCQINLAEISHLELHPLLPTKGILYFFFDEDYSFASKSICKVHYEASVPVSESPLTDGFKTSFRPVYTFPNSMTSNYGDLERQFEKDRDNLELFVDQLHEAMGYFWYSSLFLAEPIPMQGPPFETSANDPDYKIPLLDFVQREPKYHVGIAHKN